MASIMQNQTVSSLGRMISDDTIHTMTICWQHGRRCALIQDDESNGRMTTHEVARNQLCGCRQSICVAVKPTALCNDSIASYSIINVCMSRKASDENIGALAQPWQKQHLSPVSIQTPFSFLDGAIYISSF
jgi:hypothetical protein